MIGIGVRIICIGVLVTVYASSNVSTAQEGKLGLLQAVSLQALPRDVRNSGTPEPLGAVSMRRRVILSISSQSIIRRSLPVFFADLCPCLPSADRAFSK